ncbi:MAG: hypothetical protein LDL56_02865 [Armatimonadetes bacterium]|nr:hypothetical protein [Armatimonadota bacterium]MCA1996151.1 hypothetical protein [Armatimonadota bacterium]
MGNWFSIRQDTQRAPLRSLAAEHLKRCPLCGALNAVRNEECFVCRWHGAFDHDAERIEHSLSELVDRCPELASAMARPRVSAKAAKPSLWSRLGRWFRKRIDLSA